MIDKKQYGVGLIGAGWVAGEYVKVFRDLPQTQIAGIYNRTPGKASSLLRSHGVDAQEYATIDDFFADDGIDIVVSCTQPNVRADHCVRAAESGRHIVIEKPVGITRRDTARIRDAVARTGVKTVTSFVLRWNPQFVTVRTLIEDGVLGDLIYGEADYWHPARRNTADSPYLHPDEHLKDALVHQPAPLRMVGQHRAALGFVVYILILCLSPISTLISRCCFVIWHLSRILEDVTKCHSDRREESRRRKPDAANSYGMAIVRTSNLLLISCLSTTSRLATLACVNRLRLPSKS